MSYSGRYANALRYQPGRQTGVYREYGGPRNALAGMMPQPQDNPPFSVTQRPAPSAGAPTLSGGTGAFAGGSGALSGGGYIQSGAGDSAQGEYGGPGPTGAPSTGNFVDDVTGYGRAAGPAIASIAFGGPFGLASVVGGALAAGALRAAGLNATANSLATATFGSPFGGMTSVENTATEGETGGLKADTAPDVSAENPADTSGKDFGSADPGGFGAENTSTTGETGGSKGDTAGDVGADSPAFREGGYTGHDGDGELEPMSATLHEGEFVLRPEAVAMYGVDFLRAMNAGQVPRNALAGAMAQQRATSANHLLQRLRG
jgi:hypothetical protein